jgi:hypothetical protein
MQMRRTANATEDFPESRMDRILQMDENNLGYRFHSVHFRGDKRRNNAGVAGLGLGRMRSFGGRRCLSELAMVQEGA